MKWGEGEEKQELNLEDKKGIDLVGPCQDFGTWKDMGEGE